MLVPDGSTGWRIRFVRGGLGAALSGDARVVASDRVAAQSVCGGTDLGRVDRPLRRGRASPDWREPGGAGGDGAGLVAPRSAAPRGDSGVVPRVSR